MRLYLASRVSILPLYQAYLCTKNETISPLHMATLTVKRELQWVSTLTMAPLHVATLIIKRELPNYEILSSVSTLPLYQEWVDYVETIQRDVVMFCQLIALLCMMHDSLTNKLQLCLLHRGGSDRF